MLDVPVQYWTAVGVKRKCSMIMDPVVRTDKLIHDTTKSGFCQASNLFETEGHHIFCCTLKPFPLSVLNYVHMELCSDHFAVIGAFHLENRVKSYCDIMTNAINYSALPHIVNYITLFTA